MQSASFPELQKRARSCFPFPQVRVQSAHSFQLSQEAAEKQTFLLVCMCNVNKTIIFNENFRENFGINVSSDIILSTTAIEVCHFL